MICHSLTIRNERRISSLLLIPMFTGHPVVKSMGHPLVKSMGHPVVKSMGHPVVKSEHLPRCFVGWKE